MFASHIVEGEQRPLNFWKKFNQKFFLEKRTQKEAFSKKECKKGFKTS